MNVKVFWRRVKFLAKEKQVTQGELAKAIGMPLNTLKSWMSKGMIPSLDYTIGLSRYFGVSIQFLVFGKEADLSAKIKKAEMSLKRTGKKLKEIRRSAEP